MGQRQAEEIGRWLTRRLSKIVDLPPDSIDPKEKLSNYGLSPFN
jgi:hypothetical protein